MMDKDGPINLKMFDVLYKKLILWVFGSDMFCTVLKWVYFCKHIYYQLKQVNTILKFHFCLPVRILYHFCLNKRILNTENTQQREEQIFIPVEGFIACWKINLLNKHFLSSFFYNFEVNLKDTAEPWHFFYFVQCNSSNLIDCNAIAQKREVNPI